MTSYLADKTELDLFSRLNDDERIILMCISSGWDKCAIASYLKIKKSSLNKKIRWICVKLRTRNLPQAVHFYKSIRAA